jgi:hypothetical protein
MTDDIDQDETEEMKQRAREDAERDMKEVEDAARSLRDRLMDQTRVQYAASFLTRNVLTNEVQHGIIKEVADSVEEAVGMMYIELTEQFDVDQGWQPPSIILDEEPTLLLPGLDGPVAVDLSNVLGDECCPICGDPDGSCEDPDACVQNPDLGEQPEEEEEGGKSTLPM